MNLINTNKCACGQIATALAQYEDETIEPVCEACLQVKEEYAKGTDNKVDSADKNG